MTIDLYNADLQSISGSDLYQAISAFVRTDQPPDDRPREGYLLDFKENLSDRFLHSVAAFANTFGGLLIVGVSEDDGRPQNIVGIATDGELKTRVASMIASNLFPCPPFEIGECAVPSDTEGKKLCAVRVRETHEICLLARKGEKYPVYVRIEDQSSPADASQLRALLNRKSEIHPPASDLDHRTRRLEESLSVCEYHGASEGSRSQTFFRITLCPYNHPSVQLDFGTEKIFASQLSQLHPGLLRLVNAREAEAEWSRSKDWYEMRFLDRPHDYERRWRVTDRSEIGFITQAGWPTTPSSKFWSLYDIVADLVNVGRLARGFWRATGYYGSFRLSAALNVAGLRFETNKGAFSPLFYQRLAGVPEFSLDSKSVVSMRTRPPLPRVAYAEIDLSYAGLGDSLSQTVSTAANQLLRCLGHLVDLQKLRQSIDSLFFQRI